MATLNPVSKRAVKQCNRCSGTITFIKNRDQRFYAVDVFWHPSTNSFVYRSGIGAHGNLTPWHRCPPKREAPPIEINSDPLATRKAEMVARWLELKREGKTPPEVERILAEEFADLEAALEAAQKEAK